MDNKKVDILQLSKSSMQSGKKKAVWTIVIPADMAKVIDPLTGWVGNTDMMSGQIYLYFDDCKSACEYAKVNNWQYEIKPTSNRKMEHHSYSNNFAFRRRMPWTH